MELLEVLAGARRWSLACADNRDVLPGLPDASVDALVTDPPAGIGFMGKDWDGDKGGRDQWVAWLAGVARECLRVLKPGAHGLVWALPRTSHWTATALEDAGFEVRDVVMHLFGTGFPKSMDVGKALDKAAGAKRKVIGPGKYSGRGRNVDNNTYAKGTASANELVTAPATDAARQWEGWGTALKPAAEHWILVRKPLVGTVAKNVQAHGTGALNIDACRIAGVVPQTTHGVSSRQGEVYGHFRDAPEPSTVNPAGRWPAHLTLDEEAAALLDAQSGTLGLSAGGGRKDFRKAALFGHGGGNTNSGGPIGFGDSGGASRFFYVAKPSSAERDAGCESLPPKSGGAATGRADGSAGVANPRAGAGRGGGRRNFHPTVKPVSLMRWLCRLITPPGGVVLDPFAGSGSSGVAAVLEGFRFIGCELEAGYAAIAREHIGAAMPGQTEADYIQGQGALFGVSP